MTTKLTPQMAVTRTTRATKRAGIQPVWPPYRSERVDVRRPTRKLRCMIDAAACASCARSPQHGTLPRRPTRSITPSAVSQQLAALERESACR